MTSSSDSASSQAAALAGMYGDEHRLCSTANAKLALVLSCEREIDLFELEQLCDAVGWSRRPVRRVRKACEASRVRRDQVLRSTCLFRLPTEAQDKRLQRMLSMHCCQIKQGKAEGFCRQMA